MTVHPAPDRAVAASGTPRPEPAPVPPTVFGPVEVDPTALRTVARDGLTVTTTTDGDAVTVLVAGELLQETAPVFLGAVEALAADTSLVAVLVDLTPTTFMDSTGLGTLVTLHNQVAHRGGTLRLVRPASRVFRLFELTRLDGYFTFTD